MSKKLITSFILTALLLSGCATSEKSILLGSSIGLAVGGGIGSNANGSEGAAVGALIGAGLGGLIGYQGYKDKIKKSQSVPENFQAMPFTVGNASGTQGSRPRLKPAQVKVKFVEDQIKDGTFIPAHFEYEIAEPAKWEGSK